MKYAYVCAAMLLIISSLNARADTHPFDIDALLSIKDISEIALSPDEQLVAYTVSANDLEKDKRTSQVWMNATAGGVAVPMTSGDSSANQPRWSPDNRYLAVLSDRKDEKNQVWLLNRLGGDAVQLTDMKQGVSSFAWSPDGQRLLLTVTDARPADLDEKKLPNPRPWVIDRLQFKEDYVGYLDRHRTHVYVFDMETRTTRQLTFGDYDDNAPAWSPDGTQIVFESNRTAEPDSNYNTDLWIVDADGENKEPLQLTTSPAEDTSPSWRPDGKAIVYRSKDPAVQSVYALPYLAVIDVDSRDLQTFDELAEIQVFKPRYAGDGASIVTIAEKRGEQNLLRVNGADGSVSKLIGDENTVSEFDLSATGNVIALVSNPQAAAEVYRLAGDGLQRISSMNTALLKNIALGDVRKFAYFAKDGTELEGFVAFPSAYRKGRKYPGLLRVHGGPTAQYDHAFHAEAQLLAAQGYVVVMPNPRGSSGYGQAFASAIWRDWGGIDYGDVIASMDHAIDEGWVDPERTGVLGWSYGGMMTNHVITKTGRFKAAITGASATLYMANYGHDQYQRWWEAELGLPWIEENRRNWDRISPFYAIDKITTPTLVVCGEHDWNVPVLNSEQLYIGLRRQGVPTELVVYPNQYHGFDVPSYTRDLYARYFDWFGKYIPD